MRGTTKKLCGSVARERTSIAGFSSMSMSDHYSLEQQCPEQYIFSGKLGHVETVGRVLLNRFESV